MSKTLLILGMHRSGTSVISRWLQEIGINIGANLLGPNIGNEDGHFEDVDFLELHSKLLVKNNIDQVGIIGIKNLDLKLDKNDKEEIINLINKKNKLNDQWAWKEPRTCLFLDIYVSVLNNPFYFIIYRNYWDVVDSLVRRTNKVNESNTRKNNLISQLFMRLPKTEKDSYMVNEFLTAWIVYNSNILNLAMNNKDKCIILNYKNIGNHEFEIIQWIKGKGFNIEYKPFKSLFNSKKINENKKKYKIANKFLVNEAETLLQKLDNMNTFKRKII